MKTETYCLPIIMTIRHEEPNRVAKKIADAIYDGIADILESEITDCEKLEVDYSIFIKGKEEEFTEEIKS